MALLLAELPAALNALTKHHSLQNHWQGAWTLAWRSWTTERPLRLGREQPLVQESRTMQVPGSSATLSATDNRHRLLLCKY